MRDAEVAWQRGRGGRCRCVGVGGVGVGVGEGGCGRRCMRALGFLLNIYCCLGTYGERWRQRRVEMKMREELLSLFNSVSVSNVHYNHITVVIHSDKGENERKVTKTVHYEVKECK